MARRCSINAKKSVLSGNKVSHSNRKTRRRFLPNLQIVSFFSDILKKTFSLKLASNSIRTIEHNDGLDNFLLTTPAHKLANEAQTLKRKISKAQAKVASA